MKPEGIAKSRNLSGIVIALSFFFILPTIFAFIPCKSTDTFTVMAVTEKKDAARERAKNNREQDRIDKEANENGKDEKLNDSYGVKSLFKSNFMGDDGAAGMAISIIGLVAKFVGVLLAGWGLFKLLMAIKDHDPSGVATALTLIGVGVVAFFATDFIKVIVKNVQKVKA